MEKTIEVGGVRYTARRRTNLNEISTRYFKQAMSLFYVEMAEELGVKSDHVSKALVEFAHISGQVTGGVHLLSTDDEPEVIIKKCRAWLDDGDLFELGAALTDLLKSVNFTQPDPALAPDPLPENADPKVLSAAKPNKKRRVNSG